MGRRPLLRMEAARPPAEVHPVKARRTRRRAAGSSLPQEAGLRASARSLDASRTQRYVDHPARAPNPRSRLFRRRRSPQINGRSSRPPPRKYRAYMAFADVRALASSLPRKIHQARRPVLATRGRRLAPPVARFRRPGLRAGGRMIGSPPINLPGFWVTQRFSAAVTARL